MIKWAMCIAALFISSVVWATPATQVQLSYDLNTQMLHVKANHPTDRMDRYYIRRVIVRNSKGEEQSFDFTRQNAPAEFSADLNYKAEAGERLFVELYSSEGGVTKAFLNTPDGN